jgi:integrase
MIVIAYRHGLRVGELVTLRWDQIDLEQGLLHVSRLKNGVPSTHPLRARRSGHYDGYGESTEFRPTTFLRYLWDKAALGVGD